MPFIPPEVVEKAREMDLLTYLKNTRKGIVHFGGNTIAFLSRLFVYENGIV